MSKAKTSTTKKKKRASKTKEEVKAVPVSAPVPVHTDGRPSLDQARQILKDGLRAQQDASERPGKVTKQEIGLVYYYWDAMDVAEDRQERLRIMLAQRGYWKCEGPEHVPGVPHAEIWCTYEEVYKQIAAASKKRWEKQKRAVTGGR